MNIEMPDWPAMMNAKMAAQYCGLSQHKFHSQVVAGALPEPILLAGKKLWYRAAIEEKLRILVQKEHSEEWRDSFYEKIGEHTIR